MLDKKLKNEILDYLKNNERCNLMVENGEYNVYPEYAMGYGELVFVLEPWDLTECDNEEHYFEWLESCLRERNTLC